MAEKAKILLVLSQIVFKDPNSILPGAAENIVIKALHGVHPQSDGPVKLQWSLDSRKKDIWEKRPLR